MEWGTCELEYGDGDVGGLTQGAGGAAGRRVLQVQQPARRHRAQGAPSLVQRTNILTTKLTCSSAAISYLDQTENNGEDPVLTTARYEDILKTAENRQCCTMCGPKFSVNKKNNVVRNTDQRRFKIIP
jgi:hypothetical protein